ncbi:MAG: conserved membrane protein of unknown function [Candidatus Thorarchaeota archaeon]|nr:MAG: conserved membrane protein of unknown function [Candidatus Thorarchaeota archaeon]
MLSILIAAITAFLIVIIFTPGTIHMLQEKGVYGVDVHKRDRPKVPKGGGFVILFAIVTGLLLVIGMTSFLEQSETVNPALLAALVSILMASMIGILDDNLDFRNRTKVVLPLVASIPMMALQVGTRTMNIPIIGPIDLGVLYPLVVVPLMMTFIIDSTNMYGGMNGLESGLAAVNSSAIVIYSVMVPILSGETIGSLTDSGIVAAALFGAVCAFFVFNKYPAKILPGDVGRLPIGATLAAALIIGNMDRLAIMLYTPFLINFLMYLFYRIYVKRSGMEYSKFADVRENGTLEVKGPFTMYWVLPYLSNNITEKKNVRLLILLQMLIAYGTVIFLLFTYL